MEEEKKQEKSQEEKTYEMQNKVKYETEKLICQIVDGDLQPENIKILGELVDIHKDISNEEYWKIKEEVKYMRNYGRDEYGARRRDGRGRYMDGGSYGRRGVPGSGRGNYRGYGHDPEEMMEEMKEYFMDYQDGREEYNDGNSYNGEEQMVQATEGIMKNITEIVKEFSQTDNPEVMEIIKKYGRKIMEM